MIQHTLGAVFSPKDLRDYRLEVAKAAQFPDSFELSMNGIKNQGSISSCVAHSIAEVIEYHNMLQGNKSEMSIGYVYGNRRNSNYKNAGMIVRDAIGATCEYGDAILQDFPEHVEVPSAIDIFENKVNSVFDGASKAHFARYYKVTTTDEIKTALMNDGPVIFAMSWYSDFRVNSNGILSSSYNSNLRGGGHCMVIYGWNKHGWLIQNSWGRAWGVNGCAILPFEAPITEAWGVCDDTSDTTLRRPYNSKIGRFFAKIFNAISNFVLNLLNSFH